MSSIFKSNRVELASKKLILFENKEDIIKSHNKSKLNSQELLNTAIERSEKILSQAEDKSQQIKLKAQLQAAEDAKQATKEGYEKGYAQGRTQGYEQGLIEGKSKGKESYKDAIQKVEELKKQHIEDRKNLHKLSEKNMVMLSIEIARKLMGQILEEDEKAYTKIAFEVLKEIQGEDKVQIKVSSKDYLNIMEDKELLLSSLEGINDLEIIEDAFINRGSCTVDIHNGTIDGGVDTQIDKIKVSFDELLSTIE